MVTVRQLREDRGWTQAELADRLGINRATVVRWESGEFRTDAPSKMARLALAYVFWPINADVIEFGAATPRKAGYPKGRKRKPAPVPPEPTP